MSDAIIVVILVIVVALGIRETIKHFKGEGACCGGASSKPKKKKLKGKIVHTYRIHIEGMHCQNCVNRVMSAINDLSGVSAKVKLKKKEAIVYCDREVSVETIIKTIEDKGYKASLK